MASLKQKICITEWCDSIVDKRPKHCEKHYYQIRRNGKEYISYKDKRPAIIKGDIAKIPLGAGAKAGYAIVDKEFAYLANDNWCISLGYAIRCKDMQKMHRLIMKAKEGIVIDHINGNRLDNRNNNLRICTLAENNRNQFIKKSNTTGFKGIHLNKQTGKYQARVRLNYKRYYGGEYSTPQEAAKAYDALAVKLHGKFARLNFG